MLVFRSPSLVLTPGKFFLKRFVRIIKPLLLLVALVLFVSLLLYGTSWLTASLALTGILSVLGFSNVYLHFAAGDYYAVPIDHNPLVHLWSISAELQFYAVVALTMLLAGRLSGEKARLKLVTVSIATFGAISLVLFLVIPFLPLTAFSGLLSSYFMPQARFWQFALGFVAYGILKSRISQPLVFALVTLAGISIFASLVVPQSGSGAISPLSLPASFISAALLLCGRQIGGSLGRALLWIGDRSYSIYLWHLPIIWGTGLVLGEMRSSTVTIAILLTMGIAWTSHKFFESGRRSFFSATLSGALLFPLVAIPLSANFGQSQNDSPLGHPQFIEGLKATYSDCEIDFDVEVSCLQNSNQPTILVLGDSHAEHLLPGLSRAGASVVGIYTSLPPGQGHDTLAKIATTALLQFDFQTIIISAKWEKNVFNFKDFSNLLADFRGTQADVFVAGQSPILPRYPDSCFHLASDSLCRFELTQFSINSNEETFENTTSLGWEFIDLLKATCSERNCDMRLPGGSLAFRDRSHLTLLGSDHIGKIILRQVAGGAD